MATMSAFLPLSNKEQLQKEYVGKSLKDVPTPAAILDLHKLKTNFGNGSGAVNIVVSTLIEAENILPLLLKYKSSGRPVNLLYSFPVPPSAVDHLSSLNSQLGAGGLSLMVDHHLQLPTIIAIYENSGIAPNLFIKIDMGGHRAGVTPQTEAASKLITSVLELDTKGIAILYGLYSHAGQSYSSSNRATALDFLRQEFESLLVVADTMLSISPSKIVILSVGATPTTTSIRNLLISYENAPEDAKAIAALKGTIETLRSMNCSLEIHAGVYPTLDVQQLATHALPTEGPDAMLTWDDVAITILAEVASLYPGRGEEGKGEVLIGAGSLALGREPCKAYPGWGVLSPWNRGTEMQRKGPEEIQGWVVGRISQEHGILTWSGEGKEEELHIGQKIRVWPNHACIAGVGYGWYLLVDSSREGKEDEIVDVWPRWRGW
ncbi:hypothetical protein B7494_g3567 [Chlorociboria aeruginascens]|nr:hypothetical protein B7494_g3567 [Chlorociboria aeruginascens]